MASAFLLTCQVLTLVLEEDGTVVDSEAFFQSLPTNTQLMVLRKGEEWTQNKVGYSRILGFLSGLQQSDKMLHLCCAISVLLPQDGDTVKVLPV